MTLALSVWSGQVDARLRVAPPLRVNAAAIISMQEPKVEPPFRVIVVAGTWIRPSNPLAPRMVPKLELPLLVSAVPNTW